MIDTCATFVTSRFHKMPCISDTPFSCLWISSSRRSFKFGPLCRHLDPLLFYPAVIYRLFLQSLRSFLLILHIRTLLPCPIDYVNELENTVEGSREGKSRNCETQIIKRASSQTFIFAQSRPAHFFPPFFLSLLELRILSLIFH